MKDWLPRSGDAMDDAIRDYLRLRYAVVFGERTIERVKCELGSASMNGDSFDNEMEIVGKQLANGAALPVTINAHEVRQALEPVLSEIISAVRRVIEDATPEVTADIYYSGLILTGGGALLHGLPERLENDLQVKVKVPEDPLATVALGAGRLLEEPDRLQRASLRLDAPVWEQAQPLVVNW